MTNQETFDFILNHIRQQGKPSMDTSGDCAYRGENGLKCAAGCLIDDDEYQPEMEGRACGPDKNEELNSLEWNKPKTRLVLDLLIKKEIDFILARQCQYVHDCAADYGNLFMLEFEMRMKTVAENHNLNYREVAQR